jgi:hypothetical protein
MAFLPWGKADVGTMSFPPKEATHMSREVKYIGMDVHKEAIVIAVLNDGGKLVMTQDPGHCLDTLEKGGTFRHRTTESASRLSVTQNSGIPGFYA